MLGAGAFAALVAALGAGSALADKPPVPGNCSWPSMTQPFVPWGDTGSYFLSPGGSFEDATNPWTLTAGAAVVSGNEPSHVHAASDSHSLAVPNGASATTPLICVTMDSPDLRLFAINTGGTTRPLHVLVNYTANNGKAKSADVATLKGGASWAPTAMVKFLDPLTDVLQKQGQTAVSFTFKVDFEKDHPASWRIDDMYVDPIKHH